MQYLVDMKLAASSRPSGGAEEGIAFIEQLILPSLEACETLLEEKKILAGGPAVGAIRLLFIVSADSAQELDELVSSLPIWPRMETTLVPLTHLAAARRLCVLNWKVSKLWCSNSRQAPSNFFLAC